MLRCVRPLEFALVCLACLPPWGVVIAVSSHSISVYCCIRQNQKRWETIETPLRKVFKTARLELDNAAAKARERTTGRQAEMSECMKKMAEERSKQLQELDKSGGETRQERRQEKDREV